MGRIGGWILEALRSPDDERLAERIRRDVASLCQSFPVPASRLVSREASVA
jgi:glycine/serine hydroxymethyltransferase